MSDRSRKILNMALEMRKSTDSERSSDGLSSFDSDLDPMFLPSSDEEILYDSEESDSGHVSKKRKKRRKQDPQKRLKSTEQDPVNMENQPSCSAWPPVSSLVTEVQQICPEGEPTVPDEFQNHEIVEDMQEQIMDEFFDVDLSNNRPVIENVEDQGEVNVGNIGNDVWKEPVGNHAVFEYTGVGGIHANYAAVMITDLSPISCYRTFVDDCIIDEMVKETNLYATQILTDGRDVGRESRLHRWVPTSRQEMLKFIGIMAYMGLVKMPSIDKYWSTDVFYRNDLIPKVMTRNRFQLLLRMWHFSDNMSCPEGDRLHKVKPLLDKLVENFQAVYTPGRTFCVDESVIPFQGRLIFKQYIPQKTHRYGVKLFKLCSDNGYTWNIRIYAGKERNEGTGSVPTNIVLNLSAGLLNSGRTIIADNYYTSLELSNVLLDKKTHYIGTLRSNRRGNPKEVLLKKLKKGEVFGLENEKGICILKWRDKRDVLLLSTKHTTETVDIKRYSGIVKKPRAIIEYNEGKSSIDQSDQMSSYHSPLRKSLKWYRKLALEFLLGTAVVNAHVIYSQLADRKMKISEFRENVIRSLLGYEGKRDAEPSVRKSTGVVHTIRKKEGNFDKVRKYCKGCYAKKMSGEITKNCVKKVVTYCESCENQPHYCIECFNLAHK